ncbi:hypothetical protein [Streptomyces sp. WP-1]|uniref:hypothetical protein n=1 Tax=Streptomyces sp. WP-1 TaxID=3041497 RepID=UPI00351B8748
MCSGPAPPSGCGRGPDCCPVPRLPGAGADGTPLTRAPSPDGVPETRRPIEEDRAQAGRVEPHRVVVRLLAATGSGAAERVRAGPAAERARPRGG